MTTDNLTKFTFDGPEGRGEVWVEPGGYGLWVYVKGCSLDENGNEQPVALIDLYHQSDACPDDSYPQIVIFDNDPVNSDAVAYAKLLPTGTQVGFENGVVAVGKQVFDYPEGDR